MAKILTPFPGLVAPECPLQSANPRYAWLVAAGDCSALLPLMLIKSFYKLLLVHQTLRLIALHFSGAEFPKLRSIGKLSPLGTIFSAFKNQEGAGCTGRIGEDDGEGWFGAEEDFGGCQPVI